MSPIYYNPKTRQWVLEIDGRFFGSYFKRTDAVDRYNLYVEDNPDLGLEHIQTPKDVLLFQANEILALRKKIKELKERIKVQAERLAES